MERGEHHHDAPRQRREGEGSERERGEFYHGLDSHAVVKVLVVHGFPAL